MTFLKINGWTIPILKGGSYQPIIIGDEGRSFNGTLQRDRRVIKDKWTFESTMLDPIDAIALENLILGTGQSWNFDTDLYTYKGLAPINSSTGNLRQGVGCGGSLVYDENGYPESMFNSCYSLSVDDAITNIFQLQTRIADSTAVFYLTGGATGKVLNTNHYLVGTRSIQFVSNSAGDGLETGTANTGTSTDIAGHTYVHSSTGGLTIRVSLYDQLNNLLAYQDYTSIADAWIRVSVTGTSSPTLPNTKLRVTCESSGTNPLLVDAFQLELDDTVHTWINGSAAANDLEYSPSIINSFGNSLSLFCWAKGPAANPSSNATLFHFFEELTTNAVIVRRLTGTNTLRVYFYGDSGDYISYGNPWDDEWHSVAVVFHEYHPTGAGPAVELYLDGVLGAYDYSPSDYPDFTKVNTFYLGNYNNGNDYWDGLMDSVFVLPYSMSADQVAGMHSMTQMVNLPNLVLSGDFDPRTSVIAQGILLGSNYNGAMSGSSWYNNLRRVRFELET